ncbi:hypothetical protein GF362_01195 [Candidatus Dojkabacteria bacterium]|nr:hypothetical protein [Candidatus Dojkabacteria bacterium]
MKSKYFVIVLFATLFFLFLSSVKVSAANVTVNLFYSTSCPHCMKEKPFLEELVKEDDEVNLRTFDVGERENILILEKALSKLGEMYRGVPVTIISDKTIVGYSSDSTTGKEIESIIESVKQTGDIDIVYQVINEDVPTEVPTNTPSSMPTQQNTNSPTSTLSISETEESNSNPDRTEKSESKESEIQEETTKEQIVQEEDLDNKKETTFEIDPMKKKFEVPILGEITAGDFSLPVLTIILGVLDGFNPCAMWALLFLISLLLGMKDRKRMWILGIAFIATSAFVYFLFMTAWLNFFIFLGYVPWIQKSIGIFALGVGIYNLYDYFFNEDSSCKGEEIDKKRKVFSKLKEVTLQKNFIVAILGIIALAFAVNLVELLCSAGLPAIYTQVLSLSDLSTWQYYSYMLLYILFFMIDDLFVFFAAMITLKAIGIENKYAKLSRLLGGIVIFIIGLILLLRPELLAFE